MSKISRHRATVSCFAILLLALITGWHPVAMSQSDGAERLAYLTQLVAQNRESPVSNVVALGDEALALLTQRPDEHAEITLRLGLSWALSRQGKTEIAEFHAITARALAERRDDQEAVAQAEYHIGVAQFYQAEFAEALQAAERALEIQKEAGDLKAQGATLTLLGAIHRSRGVYDNALDFNLQALEIALDLADPISVARSRNNLGLIYWNLNQLEKALTYLRPVLDTYREGHNDAKLATILNNLGLIHIELGQPDVALQYLDEGIALHAGLDNPHGKAKLLNNLGYANDQLNNTEAALSFYTQSLQLRENSRDRVGMARSYGSIAGFYQRQGQLSDAASFYEKGLRQAEAAGVRGEQAEIHRGLAEVYEKVGNHAAALASYKRYRLIADDIDSAKAQERISALEAANAVGTKQRELEMIRRQQAEQELLLSQQQTRQAVLALASLVLAAAVAGLILLVRARSRSLAEVNASHEDLQRSTTKLKESEQRYRSVFDDAVTPKLLLDLEQGCLLEANAPAAALCGPNESSRPGTAMNDLQPDWLRRALEKCAMQSRAEVCQAEAWHDASGSLRHSEVWTTPLELDNRACAVVTVHDVTEERRLEEERIRQDKLESLGQLAGGIAHDFNNALVAVLGHVSLAQYRAESDSEVQPLLSEAEAAIQNAVQLTSQLLAFSKGGDPRRELVRVADQLKDAANFALSGSPTSVRFDIPEGLWAASLDPTQFKQAVGNLIINAAHAMPEGGTVQVSAHNLTAEAPICPTVDAGPYVVIKVTDTGPGIPAELHDKILDPYFSTKESGAGLGLATAFAIVCRHRGWLDFESTSAEGSTFTLYFPAVPGEVPIHIDMPYESPEGTGRVLVMDDDPAVQAVYRVMLARLGYELEITSDGQEAINKYRDSMKSGSRFDAVIMDLTVPGAMGGSEAMTVLLELDPQVTGIVASGYSNDPVMSNHRATGFAGALEKPFGIQELGRVLKQVLKQRRRQ